MNKSNVPRESLQHREQFHPASFVPARFRALPSFGRYEHLSVAPDHLVPPFWREEVGKNVAEKGGLLRAQQRESVWHRNQEETQWKFDWEFGI
jgi:hypothetical protein